MDWDDTHRKTLNTGWVTADVPQPGRWDYSGTLPPFAAPCSASKHGC